MNSSFECISTLQYRLKAAENQIAAFKSERKYIQMEAYYQSIIRKQETRIKALEKEVERAHAETVTVRNYWIEVTDDFDKECEEKLAKADKDLIKVL